MKKIIIAVVIVVALGVGGFFMLQNKSQSSKSLGTVKSAPGETTSASTPRRFSDTQNDVSGGGCESVRYAYIR